MPNIQIKNVPADVHERLTARARTQGQSLQQYLLVELERLARIPTNAELFDEVDRRGLGTELPPGLVVRMIEAGRAEHDRGGYRP